MKTAIIIEHEDGLNRQQVQRLVSKALQAYRAEDQTDKDVRVCEPDFSERHKLDWSMRKDAIAVWWCLGDIEAQAEDMEIELTEDQMLAILSKLEHRHDAHIGVNWEVVRVRIAMESAGI